MTIAGMVKVPGSEESHETNGTSGYIMIENSPIGKVGGAVRRFVSLDPRSGLIVGMLRESVIESGQGFTSALFLFLRQIFKRRVMK